MPDHRDEAAKSVARQAEFERQQATERAHNDELAKAREHNKNAKRLDNLEKRIDNIPGEKKK